MGLFDIVGKVLGGNKTKSEQNPWGESVPYLTDTMEAANKLFEKGQLGGIDPGFGTVTKQGLSSLAALGRNNGVTDAAVGGLQGFMDAPGYQSALGATPSSYGSIDPNFGIQAVRDNISAEVLPQVASMFGQNGFANSGVAEGYAAKQLASALAPVEYDQINRNQGLDINQFNVEQERDMTRDAQLFDQFATQQGQTLQGLSLAPTISDMQTQDAQTLLGVGQLRDQQKFKNKNTELANIEAAANFYIPFGQLGGSGSQTGSALDTIGKVGSTASSLFALGAS